MVGMSTNGKLSFYMLFPSIKFHLITFTGVLLFGSLDRCPYLLIKISPLFMELSPKPYIHVVP